MDVTTVRWLVVGVVLIAATMMLRSAFVEKDAETENLKLETQN